MPLRAIPDCARSAPITSQGLCPHRPYELPGYQGQSPWLVRVICHENTKTRNRPIRTVRFSCFRAFVAISGLRDSCSVPMRFVVGLVLIGAAVWAARLPAQLAARGESPAAFGRRCIPSGCVAPPSNIPDILGRRALPAGRIAALGATPDLHHGLLERRLTAKRSKDPRRKCDPACRCCRRTSPWARRACRAASGASWPAACLAGSGCSGRQ